MATIWENVKYNPYERQTYTKYELSAKVKELRKKLNLSVHQFAEKYDIPVNIINDIEEAKRSFNVNMYRACSKILELSIDEMLRKDKEKRDNISYRKIDNNSSELDNNVEIANTVEIANSIFHEMVMQHKYNVGN